MYCGILSGCPLSVNVYFAWRDSRVLSEAILTKLATNIHHVSTVSAASRADNGKCRYR